MPRSITTIGCVHLSRTLRRSVHVATVWILLFAASPLFATTLVVRLESGRILLAADTRQERMNPGATTVVRALAGDTRCKIRSFGGIGFALTGFIEYKGGDPASTLADWDANADAAEAFTNDGDHIRQVAADWAERAAKHFALLNQAHPEWLKQLAGTNPDHLLQVAFFVGWDKDDPVFLVELIGLDPNSPTAIGVHEQVRAIGYAPFSTNAITQELINGETDRAQHVADVWDAASEGIPSQDLGWRHVAFYVEQTAAYDEDVSSSVDVLAIPVGKPSVWLKKSACP